MREEDLQNLKQQMLRVIGRKGRRIGRKGRRKGRKERKKRLSKEEEVEVV